MSLDLARDRIGIDDAVSAGAAEIDTEIRAIVEVLSQQDEVQLRLVWRNETGRRPPATLPRHLVIRMLVYRVQANRLGDLDPQAAKRLARSGQRAGRERAKDGHVGAKADGQRSLKPGSVLIREWKNELHSVTVTSGGFEWRGTEYGSLSTVARAITGTAWSGPRFFGLSGKQAKSDGI